MKKFVSDVRNNFADIATTISRSYDKADEAKGTANLRFPKHNISSCRQFQSMLEYPQTMIEMEPKEQHNEDRKKVTFLSKGRNRVLKFLPFYKSNSGFSGKEKIWQLFGEEMNKINDELNEACVA